MMLLLLACATEPPRDPGNCSGTPMVPMGKGDFRRAIPDDAVSDEGPAYTTCTGSCGHSWTLSRGITLQGVPCESGVMTDDKAPFTASCVLARESCVDGFLLAAGETARWRPESGRLVSGTLAAPATIDGVQCFAGRAAFPVKGSVGNCRIRALVDGYPCEDVAEFDEDGHLTHCRLLGDATVTIPEARRPESSRSVDIECEDWLTFKAGSLQACKLAAPASLEGLDVPAGNVVSWGPDGLQLRPKAIPHRDDVPGCAGRALGWPTGSIAVCDLVTPRLVGGVHVPSGARVRTDPWGRLTGIDLAGTVRVEGVPCTGSVKFHPPGKLSTCRLGVDYAIGSTVGHAGWTFTRDEAGREVVRR